MRRNVIKSLTAGLLVAGMCCSMILGEYGNKVSNGNTEVYASNINQVSGESIKAVSKIDSLYNPVYNVEKDQMEFSYVYFGSYPQSEVTGDALTEEIINAEYVSGDAVVDGVKYRRMKEEDAYYSYERWKEDNKDDYSEERIMDRKRFYFNWGDGEEYHYFRYEPIKWRVIKKEGSQVLLLADSVLDHRAYHVGHVELTFYWLTSQLRMWLNNYDNSDDGFLVLAFSDEEEQMLCETFLGSKWDKDRDIKNKMDKVFVIDEDELLESGISDSDSLQLKMSDYTFARGLHKPMILTDDTTATVEYKIGEQVGSWWLRETWECFGDYVDYEGIFGTNLICGGYSENHISQAYLNDMSIGVCPAIMLDLTNEDLWEAEASLSQDEVKRLKELLAQTSQAPQVTPTLFSSEQPEESPEVVSTEPIISAVPLEISTTSPATSNCPYEKILLGDMDGNNKIELADAQILLKAALKIFVLNEEVVRYADVNKDSEIDLVDAQKVLKQALKISVQ